MSELFKSINTVEIYRKLQDLLYRLPQKEHELEVLRGEYEILLNTVRNQYFDMGAQLSLVKAKNDPEVVGVYRKLTELEAEVKKLKEEKAILSKMIDLINSEVIRMSVEVKALRLDIGE